MATTFRLGIGWANLVADAIFRGSVGTPPAEIYLSLGGPDKFVTKNEISHRTKLVCSRGLVNGLYSVDYYHESPRTTKGLVATLEPIRMYIPTAQADTKVYKLMGHSAASGGDLLFCFCETSEIAENGMYAFGGDTMGYYTRPADTTTLERATMFSADSAGPAWIGSILHDWLWRGYDSVNSWFPVSTFPNVYITLTKGPSGTAFNLTNNNVAVARSTGSWSAVATYGTDQIPRLKISNTNTINFGTANEGTGGNIVTAKITATNTAQAFDDTLTKVYMSPSVTWAIGDTISFAPGALEIEIH